MSEASERDAGAGPVGASARPRAGSERSDSGALSEASERDAGAGPVGASARPRAGSERSDSGALSEACESGAQSDEAPEAFLFDLDGVLRVFGAGETAEIERRHGLAEGALARAAYAPERYGPALVGEVSDDDWRASVVAALVPACGVGPAIEAVADWSARLGRVDGEVAGVVAGVRAAGVPVALVVNGTTRLELDLVVLGLADSFDAVVNSARTGVAKPDAGIYEIAAGILTARPQRCVYVGAAHRYVAGAERVGMKGHLFDGIAGLRTMLAARLPTG